MSEVTRIPLADVLDFKEGPGIMAVDFRDNGVPLLRLAGLKSGAPLLEGCNYLDPDKVDRKWSHFKVDVGDVLLSTSASLGEVAVVGPDGAGAVPYTGIIRFRPKDHRVAAEFIEFALRSPDFKQQIVEMGVGSVMSHFGPTHLKHMTLRIPPLGEQRAIAEVLGALDDKIAANATTASVSHDLAQAMVRRALTGGVQPLGTIAAITMGSSPPGTSYNEEGRGVVFYQGVRDFGVRTPSNRVWTDAPVRFAEPGDTLVSVRAPVGRTNVAYEVTCIGRGLAGARSVKGAPRTLFHLLTVDPSIWDPYESEGTIFGSINKKQLDSVMVPVISSERERDLEIDLQAIEFRLQAALDESRALARTRDELLPLLMSGRVRVRDAETIVEEAGA